MTLASFTTSLDSLVDLGGPPIAEIDTAEPRFPITALIDISGSTGMDINGFKDIDKINECLPQFIQKLKYPQASGPLAQVHDQIDIQLIAYSDEPVVVIDWTPAPQLPDTVPLLAAGGGTAMGKALNFAFDKILARQRRYKDQGLPRCGMPNLFHITDGEPTDVKVGDALWLTIEAKMAKAASDPAKKKLLVRHLLAPNGFIAAQGQTSGADKIASWFGKEAVIALENGTDNFQNMVELVVRTITLLSQPGANPEQALANLNGGTKNAA